MDNKNNNYTAGYVTMPIEEYNRLLDKANFIFRALRVRKVWDHHLAIEIDKELMYPIIETLYNSSFWTEEYELIEFENLYISDIRIADAPTEDKPE
jgi:hypothetical protein